MNINIIELIDVLSETLCEIDLIDNSTCTTVCSVAKNRIPVFTSIVEKNGGTWKIIRNDDDDTIYVDVSFNIKNSSVTEEIQLTIDIINRNWSKSKWELRKLCHDMLRSRLIY